jgi:hypothetical protein
MKQVEVVGVISVKLEKISLGSDTRSGVVQNRIDVKSSLKREL